MKHSKLYEKSEALVLLFRVKHWIKNLLLYLPLVFSGRFFSADSQRKLLYGFISFSLMASCIYIFNDLRDNELDKEHPTKRLRPIPSGRIKKNTAIAMDCTIFLISIFVHVLGDLSAKALLLLVAYFSINIVYSLGLKNVPIIDVMILSSGYVVRVFYGAIICEVTNSDDLILTIIAVSMWMGFGKRRGEMLYVKEGAKRKVLSRYNIGFLDKAMYGFLTLSITFYSLWARGHNNREMIWTIPVIIFMGLRYCLDIEMGGHGDPVEVIYSDRLLRIGATIYIVIIVGILYFLQ